MNNFLDPYCERIAPGLWGEPLNTFSNIFFLLVALLLIRNIIKSDIGTIKTKWDVWLLLALIVAIGTGSSLWHLFATGWTLWADRAPILLFINLYFLSCLIRILHFSAVKTLILFIAYHTINTATQFYLPPMTLNGSLFYIPTALFLVITTVLIWRNDSNTAKLFFLPATFLFFAALILRTVDLSVCDKIPIGTHFVWHILIAFTIYYLMNGLIIKPTTRKCHEK